MISMSSGLKAIAGGIGVGIPLPEEEEAARRLLGLFLHLEFAVVQDIPFNETQNCTVPRIMHT
tara:strand:+ start:382 stop:570 length:189 start_codon:yes stop_codon:yes gene_type:complete